MSEAGDSWLYPKAVKLKATTTELRIGLLLAVPVCVIDTFVLDGFIPAFIFCSPVVFLGFRHRHFREALTGLLLFGLVLAVWWYNGRRAEQQGRDIVDAGERYKSERGDYPRRLEQLVPRYLPEIPPGKLVWRSRWIYSFIPQADYTAEQKKRGQENSLDLMMHEPALQLVSDPAISYLFGARCFFDWNRRVIWQSRL